ncbi:MAG: c-type cytochrome [Bdellovibrionales bacterium]|nr:c-type cytochrome [Bdellovibrionales bacterium]
MNKEQDLLIKGHEYDGIKEYDNPLPGWWLFTFYATIIFAFIYVIHYEFGGGPTIAQELEISMKEIQAAKPAQSATLQISEEDLIKKTEDPKVIAMGAEVFTGKCASCHGNELQGIIGPNLTDKFWIHGKGKLSDMVTVIKSGVLDKGMPPWDGILKEEEIIAVAGFIHSKKGSNPPNPKAPQGDAVE